MIKFFGLLFFGAAFIVALIFVHDYRNDFCAALGCVISAAFFFLTTLKIADKIIGD